MAFIPLSETNSLYNISNLHYPENRKKEVDNIILGTAKTTGSVALGSVGLILSGFTIKKLVDGCIYVLNHIKNQENISTNSHNSSPIAGLFVGLIAAGLLGSTAIIIALGEIMLIGASISTPVVTAAISIDDVKQVRKLDEDRYKKSQLAGTIEP